MPGLNKVMFGLKMKITLCISKVRILNKKSMFTILNIGIEIAGSRKPEVMESMILL